jgi:hypothetical protein
VREELRGRGEGLWGFRPSLTVRLFGLVVRPLMEDHSLDRVSLFCCAQMEEDGLTW